MANAIGTLTRNKCLTRTVKGILAALALTWATPTLLSTINTLVRWGIDGWVAFHGWSGHPVQVSISVGLLGIGCFAYLICWGFQKDENEDDKKLMCFGLITLGSVLLGVGSAGMVEPALALENFWCGFGFTQGLSTIIIVSIWSVNYL